MKRHGTTRGFAWMHGDRLVNWTKELATRGRPDVADPPIALEHAKKEQRIVAVRVITEREFQRLVKRALSGDSYTTFFKGSANHEHDSFLRYRDERIAGMG